MTVTSDFELVTAGVGDHGFVVSVSGEADLYRAPELRHELFGLVDGGATWLIVDLTSTTFVDSTALTVLLGTAKRLRPTGGEIGVVCTDPNVRKIFEITLLDQVFRLYESRDEALNDLAARTA